MVKKKYKTFLILAVCILMVAVIPVAAEDEKSVTKVYLACGADIPVSIAYSEYNEELGQEYAGTLYMTSGDMKPGFQFYAVYEGTLDRADSQTSVTR